MILDKLNGLIHSINVNFSEILRSHGIILPPIFQMLEAVVVTSIHDVEYRIQLRNMFHNTRMVSSAYCVTSFEAESRKDEIVVQSQELFYTELTKYMMFVKTSEMVELNGHKHRIVSMADILNDIISQFEARGGFVDVDTAWLQSVDKRLGNYKRLDNG